MRPLVLGLMISMLAGAGTLDDYLTGLAREQWTARKKAVEAIRTPAQVRERQEFIRSWMLRAIGGLPPKTPLNPVITSTAHRDGYRIEKLVFESMPKFYVTAAVFVPEGSGPFPAVLGVAGHSETGKAIDTYQHVWISLAKRGVLVLAFDPPGQGERSEYFDPATGKSSVGIGVQEHIMAGTQALLTGTTIARYEINDGVRAFDYLLTRKDVDPKRIGVAGNSGGGTQSAYLAVAEPRLAAAVSSCYITSWETLWAIPGPQDSEQIFPNFLRDGLDFGDFLLAFAPKPILMTTAIQDFFPIAGARATYAEQEKLFRVADAPGRVGYFEFDDTHGWSQPRREAAYRWFARWLQDKEGDEGREPLHTVEPPQALNATRTGQVSTSYPDSETVWSINRKLAENQYAGRRALSATPDELRAAVSRRLAVSRPPAHIDGDAASVLTEGDTRLAISVRKPRVPLYTLVWIGDAESATVRNQPGEAGTTVVAFQPRGFDIPPPPKKGGYSPEYQTAMRALLVGKTMLGLQVTDALHVLAWVRQNEPHARIRIGGATPRARAIALIAAALEGRDTVYRDDGPLPSFLGMARQKTHSGMAGLAVPGVLQDFDVADLKKLVTSN
jgi:cephalosporin-C deacetylase-like acetyl esterase